MRGTTPTIHCDADDGDCGNWDVDNYRACVSRVNGVQITSERRAPGWSNGPHEDLCPEHASTTKEGV